VGREDKDRVGELTEFVEQGDQAADILVGAVEHRSVGLHMAHKETLLVGGNLVPGGYGRITIGKPGAGWNQSHRGLAPKAPGTNRVPAGIVTAAIFCQ